MNDDLLRLAGIEDVAGFYRDRFYTGGVLEASYFDAIDRFDNVTAVVHGHAHRGRHAGRTPRGTPVYNCAMMVAEAELNRPYALIEI